MANVPDARPVRRRQTVAEDPVPGAGGRQYPQRGQGGTPPSPLRVLPHRDAASPDAATALSGVRVYPMASGRNDPGLPSTTGDVTMAAYDDLQFRVRHPWRAKLSWLLRAVDRWVRLA